MITKESYQQLVIAGANVAKSLYLAKTLESYMNAATEESTMVLTDVFEDDNFARYSDAVNNVASDYSLYEAVEALCNVAMELESEYANPQELKMAYLLSISAVAFDAVHGEQYASLMLDYITTGQGDEELTALESKMDTDEISWVSRNI